MFSIGTNLPMTTGKFQNKILQGSNFYIIFIISNMVTIFLVSWNHSFNIAFLWKTIGKGGDYLQER